MIQSLLVNVDILGNFTFFRMMPQNFQQGGPPPGHYGPQDGPYQEQMQYGQPYDPSQVSVIPPQGYY